MAQTNESQEQVTVNVETLQPVTRTLMTIGALPTSYLISMTYEEQLLWLQNYLIQTVIPAINNNAEATQEVQDIVMALQDYINTQFSELNLQEYIDNKLDEMLESGVFENILMDYVQLTKVYDTYNEMIFDAYTFTNGMKLKTLGYHFINDGGGADYVVTNIQSDTKYQVSIGTNLWIEMIIKDSVNVKQFGAYGDGVNDDTIAIQNSIDIAWKNKIKLIIPSTENYYKTTTNLYLYCGRGPTGYWSGNGSILEGDNQGKSRIVKIGNTEDSQGYNATIVGKNQGSVELNGTGIMLNNLSIEHYDDDENFAQTRGYALYSDISRSSYTNLNINSFKGMRCHAFSSLYENIVFDCIEEALYVDNGTSSKFRFLYAPGCYNPYRIQSSYSTLLNVCCDNATGTLFKLGGIGLSLINCGCESPKAQHIFESVSNFTRISIKDFYMFRQEGDSENNIALEDCSIVKATTRCVINIDGLYIQEMKHIDGNSYVFDIPELLTISTILKNYVYYKNYDGTSNEKMLLWKKKPALKSMQQFEGPNGLFNYFVSTDLKIIPSIGGFDGSSLLDTQGNSINPENFGYNKSIWLDVKDKYHTESGYDARYSGKHMRGDLQLYNDPKLMNSLGLSITEMTNEYTWTGAEIPLVLRGATADRPTQNLFIGLQYFDTTLKLPIYWNGTKWIKADGTDA